MKKLLFLFVALVATTTLWASNTITYTATEKLPETTEEWRGGLHTNAFNVEIISHEFSNGVGTITFAGEVTTIGGNAFRFCESMTSITIPNSVTTIGDYAFYECSGLTSITIPNSVTSIGKVAFYWCTSLTSINVDAANTHYCSIDGVLFNYAKDTLIQYPAGNTQTEYTIPNSVTTIGYCAFDLCSSLTTVTISNSVTTIGEGAFLNCDGLVSISIPNSVTTIGEIAFQSCYSLTSIDVDTANTHYSSIDGVLFNYTKNTLIQYPAGNIQTEYTIPNSVATIGRSAFYGCSGLISIDIPNSVTTIESWAFSISGLRDVSVAWTSREQLPTMGDYVFATIANLDGPSVATLLVPAGTKSIYEAADQWKDFGTITDKQPDPKNCVITYTATAKLPETTDEWSGGLHTNAFNVAITSHEFSNGTGTITFAGEVTTIGDWTFAECSGLTSITIPNSVTWITEHAFDGCSGLTSVTIPNSVTTIGDWAFLGCSSLTSVTIPNSVTTIGEGAFAECYGLTSINVDAANTHYCSIDGVLFNYAKDTLIQYPIGNTRTEYTIPHSVTTIGRSAFYGCSGLTSITIPNSVTKIGYQAFFDCSGLTSVTIPNSVTTIEYLAFYRCSGLTSVTCYAVTPPECGYEVFEYISQDAKVYVPASALADYQSAYYWKDMQLYPIAANVTPMDDENPVVTPTDQDVTITWPITDGTDTYTLTITKNGETVCILTFNANGQLTNIAFAAPGHDGAHQAPAATLTAQGYQFTVTGLTPGTAYDYSVTATDAGGQTLAEHKGNFSTTGGTGLNTLPYEGKDGKGSKYFHNGNLIIERNGIKYTPAGQKVK